MKFKNYGSMTLGCIAAALVFFSGTAGAQQKPKVIVLATGGTIAGAQEATTSAGYQSGAFSIDQLVKAVPELKDIAEITGEQVVNIGSQDMNDEVWLKLAKRVNEVLSSNNIDGIVITHGTDTMEETSFFLDLVSKTGKPIVLTGSMRPATAISPDGPLNLYNAVAVAVAPESKDRGVLVVANDQIHSARDVVKTHTTSVDTFKSADTGPIGAVNYGKIVYFDAPEKQTNEKVFTVGNTNALPKVDIVYAHANMGPEMVNAAVDAGAKGIVVAGVGDGNVTKPALDALADAAKHGVVVVRSSRVGSGIVDRNVEVNDDKMGFVASKEYNPQKARVLLALALTESKDPKKIQRVFDQF